jgi:hypothetical protein
MTGFEPAASSSRTKRATGLRYIPIDAACPKAKRHPTPVGTARVTEVVLELQNKGIQHSIPYFFRSSTGEMKGL